MDHTSHGNGKTVREVWFLGCLEWRLQKRSDRWSQKEEKARSQAFMEPGNSGWFTESFVNICKFGLSFRFIEEPRSLKLHLIVLWAAVYSFTWYGKACSATCNSFSNMSEKLFSLLPFSFYILFLLYFMEGGLSLSCTILTLSWETGFKKAISLPLFPSFPQMEVYLHSLCPPLCTCSFARRANQLDAVRATHICPAVVRETKWSHLKYTES